MPDIQDAGKQGRGIESGQSGVERKLKAGTTGGIDDVHAGEQCKSRNKRLIDLLPPHDRKQEMRNECLPARPLTLMREGDIHTACPIRAAASETSILKLMYAKNTAGGRRYRSRLCGRNRAPGPGRTLGFCARPGQRPDGRHSHVHENNAQSRDVSDVIGQNRGRRLVLK